MFLNHDVNETECGCEADINLRMSKNFEKQKQNGRLKLKLLVHGSDLLLAPSEAMELKGTYRPV